MGIESLAGLTAAFGSGGAGSGTRGRLSPRIS